MNGNLERKLRGIFKFNILLLYGTTMIPQISRCRMNKKEEKKTPVWSFRSFPRSWTWFWSCLKIEQRFSSFWSIRSMEVKPPSVPYLALVNINEWHICKRKLFCPKSRISRSFQPTALSILELEPSSATESQTVSSAKLDTSSAASSPPPGPPQC